MRIVDLILILLLLIVIGMLFIDVIRITNDGGKCVRNAASFMVEKLSDNYGENIQCYCNKGITINKTGIFRIITG